MTDFNSALHISPLAGRPGRAEHFLDVHDRDLFTKRLAINPIPMTQKTLVPSKFGFAILHSNCDFAPFEQHLKLKVLHQFPSGS